MSKCLDCHVQLWDCPSCGGLRCKCPNPFQIQLMRDTGKKPRSMGAKHYDKDGVPYTPNFLDGYEQTDYPDKESDTNWLLEGSNP